MDAILLVSGADGRWAPGIGDPTVGGWLAVVAYFAAAGLCLRAWRRDAGASDSGSLPDARTAAVWLGLAMLCAALGVNKQLDLQSFVTQIGEDIARAQGWYEHRRTVQAWFVVAMAVLGLAGGAGGLYLLRDRLAQLWPAIVGAGLLATFVVIRAASFHHVDVMLSGPAKLNWIFEIGSLCVIGWASLRRVPTTYRGPLRPAGRAAARNKGPRILPAGPDGELLPKRRQRRRSTTSD